MKKWFENNIISVLSLTGIISGAVWFGSSEGRWFSSAAKKYKTEDVIENLDERKMYGEYIIDSIEEVETKAFRLEQKKLDTLYQNKLGTIDSLLRLSVRLNYETKKEFKDGH